MADYKDIATSVVVNGEPKVETYTPASGPNAGTLQTTLSFRAYHPNFERQQDGTFKMKESDWYDVKYNGKAIEQVRGLIKNGMTLEVRGRVRENHWKDREGNDRVSHEIFANGLGLSLTQPGLRSIDYEKPAKTQQKNADRQAER